MATVNDPHQQIAAMWTFPDSESFHKMLEAMMTREDAELLLECTQPVTVAELAARLKVEENLIGQKLDALAKRGLIFRGKTQYHFRRGNHFGFAGMPTAGEHSTSEEYGYWRRKWQDENPNREVNGWLAWYEKTGDPVHRVYPARLAIKANPNIKREDLLWHEDVEQIFARAEIIVGGICGCRSGTARMGGGHERGQKCDHPLWNCFQFRKDMAEFNLGRGAQLKIYNVEEALAKSDEAEMAGLIHEGPNNAAVMPGVMCSCCNCACGMLLMCTATDRLHDLYTPSRFQPRVELDLCNGCQTCVERCPFDAINMVKVPGSKKMKAQLTPENCMGCGVCVVGCEQKALIFELVRPPEHIPPAEEWYLTAVRKDVRVLK